MTSSRIGSYAAAIIGGTIVVGAAGSARAQETVLQPAQNARERAEVPDPGHAIAASHVDVPKADETEKPAAENAQKSSQPRETSYGARAVVSAPAGTLHEEERVGDYAQPRWSATRRFPTTRVYVRPAGQFALEWWFEDKQSLKDSRQVRYRSQYELEMGLGHRLQLDLYLQTEQTGHQAPLQIGAEKAELRWALADWGALPLNPTLYVEFVRQNAGPPIVELKALFGEQLAPRWHAGLNLVFEHMLGGSEENQYAVTSGVSYTLSDSSFALGAEIKFEVVDETGQRWTLAHWELLIGPSLAWSPVPAMHVLFAALLGNERQPQPTASAANTPLFQPMCVLGWEL